jgi:tRNA1Val (adenine37-N6)-methyltransferase
MIRKNKAQGDRIHPDFQIKLTGMFNFNENFTTLKKDTEFRFKMFSIAHHQSTMKVGTDAVLLGAWVNPTGANRILEVGTGSGVIALMMAQRSEENTHIDAIEIDSNSVEQAIENIRKSPWPKKVTIHSSSLQLWSGDEKYDLIISNPPFFSNSLLPPNEARRDARHSITLTAAELLTQSNRLLAPGGRLAIILPYEEGNKFRAMASDHNFYLARQLAFFTRLEKPQERWLFEFSPKPSTMEQSSLTLYIAGNNRSEEYKRLTSDFYLD